MIVRELITRLGFQVDQSAINKADAATNRLKDNANQTADAFRNVLATVVSFASVRGIITIGDEMQNLRSRIGLLPQVLGNVGDTMDVVADHASKSMAPLASYANLFTRLGQNGQKYIKDQEDLLLITDTVSKALLVGGLNAAERGSVMTQFSQAIGSGVLQGDELRSLGEAAPDFLNKLSIAMGVPREELKKLASEGKVTAEMVIDGVRKMAGQFDDSFNKMPLTVGNATTQISNRFSLMIDKMNRDSGFITRIGEFMLTVFDKIENGIDFLVKKAGGWERSFRLIGIAIATALGSKALIALFVLRKAILAATLPFLATIAAIVGLTLVIEDLYLFIQGEGGSLLEGLIGPWSEWQPQVMAFIDSVILAFDDFVLFMIEVGSLFSNLFSADEEAFKQSLDNVMNYIRDQFALIGPYLLAGLTMALTGVQKYLTEYLPNALSVLGNMLYNSLYNSVVNALRNGFNAIKSAPGAIFDSLKGMVSGGGDKSKSIVPNVSAIDAARSGTSMSNQSISRNTTVNVTVPSGTPAEQASFLEESAKQSFSKAADDTYARDLAMFSR